MDGPTPTPDPGSGLPGDVSPETPAGTPEPTATPPAPPAPAPDLATLQARLTQAEAVARQAIEQQEAIKRYVVQLAAQPAPVDPRVAEEHDARFRALADENPKAAMQLAAEERLRPMLDELEANRLQVEAEREERFAAERLGRHEDPMVRAEWGKYAPEVRDFLAAMPLDVRAKPGVVESAFQHVKAAHLDDIIAERVRAAIARDRNGGLEPPSAGRPMPTDSALTADERRMMAQFGMDEKEWRTHKAALEAR